MATVHLEQLRQHDVANRPALGAYLSTPAVIESRAAARWAMKMSMADYSARRSTMSKLVMVHEAVRLGRRLDLVAKDLRAVAGELDAALQGRAGGWAIREVA